METINWITQSSWIMTKLYFLSHIAWYQQQHPLSLAALPLSAGPQQHSPPLRPSIALISALAQPTPDCTEMALAGQF